MNERLEVVGLTVRNGRKTVTEVADFSVAAGEIVVLADPDGLLLRGVTGLLPRGFSATADVRLDGLSLSGPAGMAAELQLGRISFIPWNADRTMSPHLTVQAMFEEAPAPPRLGPGHSQLRAVRALEAMGLRKAGDCLAAHPSDLGEAARWRVALALAIVSSPQVLLAEAPAAGLDATVRGGLLRRLAMWARENGASILLTGHTMDGLSAIADRLLPPERQRSPIVADPAAPDVGVAEPMLTVRDLRVAVPIGRSLTGGVRWLPVIHGVNFELDKGGSLALLGESGSGKSILARSLVRLAQPVGGCVTWRGANLVTCGRETLRKLRAEFQVLLSDPVDGFDPLRRVGAQIAEAVASLRPELSRRDRKVQVERMLEKVGLEAGSARLFPAALSPAQAARAGLARALAVEPQLLVCDEPLAHLGDEDGEEFLGLLRDFNRSGLMIVYATSSVRQAVRIAGRVLVLHGGKVVEDASAATLVTDARHPLTQALLAVASDLPSSLDGDSVSAMRSTKGCPLRPRCPRSRAFCSNAVPPLDRIGPDHLVACHGWDEKGRED